MIKVSNILLCFCCHLRSHVLDCMFWAKSSDFEGIWAVSKKHESFLVNWKKNNKKDIREVGWPEHVVLCMG